MIRTEAAVVRDLRQNQSVIENKLVFFNLGECTSIESNAECAQCKETDT